MGTYNVGIVGFGWAAGAHLKSFTELPEFEPVAIMTRSELDPGRIKAEYGVDVRVYNDFDAIINDENIDIIDICTPHPCHAEQVIKAADAGKHLIIEKPVALNFKDMKKMLEAVERNKTMTSVCFEVRFISVAKAMKSIIQEGQIGDVYYAECDYFHGIGPWYKQFDWNVKKDIGGSSLLTAGCHALDLLLWLTDFEVEEVFSYSTRNPNKVFKAYEYDSTSVTLLKFKGNKIIGKVASVIDCMQPYVFNMNMVGSHGSIKNNLFYSKKIEGLNGWSILDVQLVDSGDVAHHPYREQFAYFAKCIDSGQESHNSLGNTFETHRVIFAADKSAKTGKPVKLSEFKV
ncbi:MAG: Gfo/Idh/MocA family oxidoreductase [Candidatus Latescibacteria bacterium]|nr:Gfo/Idh/MocA family oxidoreductase [Candidatus Latescibacterota bacterium]